MASIAQPRRRERQKLSAPPLRILVTGFGGFPGARKNPTARMIGELVRCRPRLARAGICLELAVLPVIYAETGPRLAALAQKIRPDAILHFGVAPRRTKLCVETRALNRASVLHPDASGAVAAARAVVRHAPMSLKSTVPCGLIAAALRKGGFDAALSIDAGDYVCNQTLFLSLNQSRAPQGFAPLVGFIHVPGRRSGLAAARLSLTAATAILALAPGLRRARQSAPQAQASA
jgi:pyroglutamyl-peptidase